MPRESPRQPSVLAVNGCGGYAGSEREGRVTTRDRELEDLPRSRKSSPELAIRCEEADVSGRRPCVYPAVAGFRYRWNKLWAWDSDLCLQDYGEFPRFGKLSVVSVNRFLKEAF